MHTHKKKKTGKIYHKKFFDVIQLTEHHNYEWRLNDEYNSSVTIVQIKNYSFSPLISLLSSSYFFPKKKLQETVETSSKNKRKFLWLTLSSADNKEKESTISTAVTTLL